MRSEAKVIKSFNEFIVRADIIKKNIITLNLASLIYSSGQTLAIKIFILSSNLGYLKHQFIKSATKSNK